MIEYEMNDVVTLDGSTYCCKLAHDTSNPTITKPGEGSSWQTYWELLAAKGEPGDTGPQGAPGADGWAPRETSYYYTDSLADNETESDEVVLQSGYRLLKIQTDVPARVRLYDSTASLIADEDRPVDTTPSGAHGVILDFVTTEDILEWWLNPVVDGYMKTTTNLVPIAITNLSGATDTVTVTLTWTRSE